MRNVITICAVAAIVLVMGGLSQAAVVNVRPAGGGVGTLGDVYPTIQAAIDDVPEGSTIVVHAGTYKEQIVIWKALTLQGDGSATTIIDGVNGTGANVIVVDINAPGNVNFSGFKVKNAPITNPGDLRFGILTRSTVEGVTYTISDNNVLGTNNPDAENDYGIYGRNGGKENLVITNNGVTQTGSNNIVIETHQGTTDISYNTLDAGCYGVDAIFVMTHSGKDVANLQKVSHNTIDMGTGEGTSGATGITFAAVAEYYGVSPARFLDHSIEITNNNNIFNLKVNRRGIGFWNDAAVGSEGDIISPLVSNNTITGASGDVTTSMGIYTLGLVTDANITNNTVTGVDYSFKERVWRNNVAAGTQLNLNCFSGNSSGVLTERTSGILNAVGNFWGDASGPRHPITNPSGLGDKVSDHVIYYPWYPDCTFASPVVKRVHNITKGSHYDDIQPAINDASSGDIIEVDAGTYQENLAAWKDMEITKSLTLRGAGSGSTIVELSEGNGLGGKMNGVEIRGSNLDVTIEGITFTRRPGNTYATSYPLRVAETSSSFNSLTLRDVEVCYAEAANVILGGNGTFNNIHVEDCNFHHAGTWGFVGSGTINGMVVSDSDFVHNGQRDPGHGVGFDLTGTSSTNVTVTGGNFSNNKQAGINLMRISNSSFTGCVANNNAGAGGGGFGIKLDEWGGKSQNITFEHCVATGNGLDGITIQPEKNDAIENILVHGCVLTGNGRNGVNLCYVYSGSNNPEMTDVTIRCCNLSGNGGKGVDVYSWWVPMTITETFDARYNWWGDMSGPNDPIGTMETDGKNCYDVSVIINADGLGNAVSENVIYCPWLLVPVISSDSPCPAGDLDGDCDVDFKDFAILAENWLVGTEG
jgi:hypothetical protein